MPEERSITQIINHWLIKEKKHSTLSRGDICILLGKKISVRMKRSQASVTVSLRSDHDFPALMLGKSKTKDLTVKLEFAILFPICCYSYYIVVFYQMEKKWHWHYLLASLLSVYRLQPLEKATVECILWGSVCCSSRPLPLDVQLTVVQDRSHGFLCCSPRRECVDQAKLAHCKDY